MDYADILNRDVLSEIFLFIPQHIKRNLNKDFYQQYEAPKIQRMNSFMRTIIRKDYAFVFEYYLKLYYWRWRKITQWVYKFMKFHNYIEYIRYLCCEYKSDRCKSKLNTFEKELKPNERKKYKKMVIRNIRWNS